MRVSITLNNSSTDKFETGITEEAYEYKKDIDIIPKFSKSLNIPFYIRSVEGLPDDKNYNEYNIGDTIEIKDRFNLISNIETNNSSFKIVKSIKTKYILNRKKQYNIFLSKQENGYIKINFRDNTYRLYGIFIYCMLRSKEMLRLGSLYEDETDIKYWIDNKFIKTNTVVDTLYLNVDYRTDTETIVKYIEVCNKLSTECKFVYRILYTNKNISNKEYNETKKKYLNSTYMKKYIETFIEFVNLIKEHIHDNLNTSIIYEPYFLTSIYVFNKKGSVNPNKVFINYNNLNLIEYILYINKLCKLNSIEFINVFNTQAIIHLITEINNVKNITEYKKKIISEIECIGKYYSYFIINENQYIAYDKYHIDGGYNIMWLWSNDEWLSYLYIIKGITEYINKNMRYIPRTNNIPCRIKNILYEIPVGHINGLLEISNYSNKVYEDHTNNNGDIEDSSTMFLFGGCFKPRYSKFYENKWVDKGFKTDRYAVCYDEHISLCKEYNIKYILFGSGSNISTTNIPMKYTGNKCTDHNYTISKITSFYLNKKD